MKPVKRGKQLLLTAVGSCALVMGIVFIYVYAGVVDLFGIDKQ